MNCPNCGEEIFDEDATVCPKCGVSLVAERDLRQKSVDTAQKQTDFVLAAAILTIISATFVASTGYIGLYQYQTLLGYYDAAIVSEFFGFLIFGIVDMLCAVFAAIGGIFMLKRKHLRISILGVILLLVSVFVTYLTIGQYGYGFTDVMLFSEVSVFIFSILGGTLLFSSKAEYL